MLGLAVFFFQGHCHGGGDAAGQVWKFVNLKETCCKSIVHQEDVHSSGQLSDLPFVIYPSHSCSNNTLVVGDNVSSQMLRRTFMTEPVHVTGRTVLAMAKMEAREAKKMVSQMVEAVKMGVIDRDDGGECEHALGKMKKTQTGSSFSECLIRYLGVC